MKTTRIMIVAVGGQGNILAAKLLGEAALSCGIDVRMSEFHGMAQRGGVVESMVILGDGAGYCIADGEADVLLGFEPVETLRAARKCSARTLVITNTAPVLPFTVALGHAVYPDIPLALRSLASRVGKLTTLDATTLARLTGSVQSLNVVMLGALASSGVLSSIGTGAFEKAIQGKMKAPLALQNLRAFQSGYEACQNEIRGNSACAVE
ncbi:MAG: indolepyruvate oxidoreductase subunit beta [Smithella sp.]|nr:indolepyruvate oxidoreductase subunit beta [Smithella sp.]